MPGHHHRSGRHLDLLIAQRRVSAVVPTAHAETVAGRASGATTSWSRLGEGAMTLPPRQSTRASPDPPRRRRSGKRLDDVVRPIGTANTTLPRPERERPDTPPRSRSGRDPVVDRYRDSPRRRFGHPRCGGVHRRRDSIHCSPSTASMSSLLVAARAESSITPTSPSPMAPRPTRAETATGLRTTKTSRGARTPRRPQTPPAPPPRQASPTTSCPRRKCRRWADRVRRRHGPRTAHPGVCRRRHADTRIRSSIRRTRLPLARSRGRRRHLHRGPKSLSGPADGFLASRIRGGGVGMGDIEQTGAAAAAADDADTGPPGRLPARGLATPVHCGKLSDRSRGPAASTLDPGPIILTVSTMSFRSHDPPSRWRPTHSVTRSCFWGCGCSCRSARTRMLSRESNVRWSRLWSCTGRRGGWTSRKGSLRRPHR